MHQLDRLVAAPLGDGGVAAAAAEDGAAGLRQHGDQRVTAAGAVAGVGDFGEEGEQAAGLGEVIGVDSRRVEATAYRRLTN